MDPITIYTGMQSKWDKYLL